MKLVLSRSSMTKINSRNLRIVILLVTFVLVVLAANSSALAFGPEDPEEPTGPEVTPTPLLSPRQLQPILPENPSMADLGHQKWWSVCMACHGDAGQGLTDEWRETAFGEDKNCWTAKCHGTSHPPEGFIFPRIVPPAWGPGTLKRFITADELQQYLFDEMPWWDPGSLTEVEGWNLTAFVLRENGSLPADLELDITNASLVPVHLPIQPVRDERGWQIVFIGALGLAAVGLIAVSNQHRERNLPRPTTRREADPDSLAQNARKDPSPPLSPSKRPSFFHHLHPPTIPAAQARWRYTLGAGGLAVFLSLVLLVTGALEMFFYVPTPEEAAESIQVITYLVPFGGLIRGIHFWAAQALVLIAMIHLARVVFTGAYLPPRRFNYMIGIALLAAVLLLDFTGYVLRWDEGIRWALMVGTNLLKTIPLVGEGIYRFVIGGDSPGAPALIRFYAWHIFGLTLLLVIGVSWHIFRVRRDGGIAAPKPVRPIANPDQISEASLETVQPTRITRNELVQREVLAMLIAGALLTLIAALIPPPIAPPIQDSPTALLADARAPWFFLWVQQLLRFGDAFWMGVAIPLATLALLIALPYLFKRDQAAKAVLGRWFPQHGRAAQVILGLILLGWIVLTVLEYRLP